MGVTQTLPLLLLLLNSAIKDDEVEEVEASLSSLARFAARTNGSCILLFSIACVPVCVRVLIHS